MHLHYKNKWAGLALLALGILTSCSKNGIGPQTVNTSAAGRLSRYELAGSDYDVSPVTTFVASYDKNGNISNLFEKSGQTLISYALSYNNGRLAQSAANNLGVQKIIYDAAGKPLRINYTTLTDTGKLVFGYDVAGKLISMLDSVKQPLKLSQRFVYSYTYDAAGANVVQITKNQLDLQGRPTLRQYSFFKFDSSPNPFIGFPYLQNSARLPGDVPALINRNNVVSVQIVGTILNTSSGGSAPTLDTITTYRATRIYDYNSNGLPLKATERFNDVQFNYSGSRTFTYDY